MAETPNLKQVDKKTVERSVAYPGITLDEAIKHAEIIRKNLGSTIFSRDSAAKALGHPTSNGTSNKKIAGCVHFGLLTRQGTAYRQSPLADKYFLPTSEGERSGALVEAIQAPTLYGKLLNDFNGKSLPQMLESILTRTYGITEKASSQAAKDFQSSAEFAGVLINGIITLEGGLAHEDASGASQEDITDLAPTNKGTSSVATLPSPQIPADILPVKIPKTGVTILFPVSYAYDLSVGTFSEGIKALASNILANQPVEALDDESDTTAEN